MVFKRQSKLVNLIDFLTKNNIFKRTYLFKAIFLLSKEYNLKIFQKYDFHPYKFGPYSIRVEKDINKLLNEKFLVKKDNFYDVKKKEGELDFNESFNDLVTRFKSVKQIIDYVYDKYPEFAKRSDLIEHEKVEGYGLYDIGYEKKNIDSFLNILIQNNISCLIDVRRNAFSMNFDYTKKLLKNYLNKRDIDYVHIKELGIESSRRKNLNTKKDYEELFSEYRDDLKDKKSYVSEIVNKSKKVKTVMMCFEKDNDFCHRGVIKEFIENMGGEVISL